MAAGQRCRRVRALDDHNQSRESGGPGEVRERGGGRAVGRLRMRRRRSRAVIATDAPRKRRGRYLRKFRRPTPPISEAERHRSSYQADGLAGGAPHRCSAVTGCRINLRTRRRPRSDRHLSYSPLTHSCAPDYTARSCRYATALHCTALAPIRLPYTSTGTGDN